MLWLCVWKNCVWKNAWTGFFFHQQFVKFNRICLAPEPKFVRPSDLQHASTSRRGDFPYSHEPYLNFPILVSMNKMKMTWCGKCLTYWPYWMFFCHSCVDEGSIWLSCEIWKKLLCDMSYEKVVVRYVLYKSYKLFRWNNCEVEKLLWNMCYVKVINYLVEITIKSIPLFILFETVVKHLFIILPI